MSDGFEQSWMDAFTIDNLAAELKRSGWLDADTVSVLMEAREKINDVLARYEMESPAAWAATIKQIERKQA